MYTDGGPDHRLTYVSVQIALIALFLELDLDFLCAVRTPPHNSWKNPAERIMNLALQGVGIARGQTAFEDHLQRCKNIKQIRDRAKTVPGLEIDILDSLERPKRLLSCLFQRLMLKEEPFSVFTPASEEVISSLWENIQQIDSSLERKDTTQKLIQDKKQLIDFLESHCKVRHYNV